MKEAIRQGDIPGVQLRRRRLLPGAAAATAWAWLRKPEKLERWIADRVALAAGGTGALELCCGRADFGDRADGAEVVELGETIVIEPSRRWVLAFRRSGWEVKTRLELEVTETPGGAEVSILQQGFEKLPLSTGLTLWEAYRRRWAVALDRLAAAVEASG